MGYPPWRKRVDRVREYIFPWRSEADFIKIMGRLWLWRHGFDHQVEIGPYRADFASTKLRLIIEIEGRSKVPKYDSLQIEEYKAYKQARENFLLRKGYLVLYVPTYTIWHHPNGLRRAVKHWVRRQPAKLTTVRL